MLVTEHESVDVAHTRVNVQIAGKLVVFGSPSIVRAAQTRQRRAQKRTVYHCIARQGNFLLIHNIGLMNVVCENLIGVII